MSVLLELPNRRLFAPAEVFGGRYRHPCHANCGNTMVVPDPETEGAPDKLRPGQIWGCLRCGAAHEYYMVYLPGVRSACVRLLRGIQQREGSEPTISEFTGVGLEAL